MYMLEFEWLGNYSSSVTVLVNVEMKLATELMGFTRWAPNKT